MARVILLIASTFLLLSSACCWDAEELELFDLAEEVNRNFYEVFGVEQVKVNVDERYYGLTYHGDVIIIFMSVYEVTLDTLSFLSSVYMYSNNPMFNFKRSSLFTDSSKFCHTQSISQALAAISPRQKF